jgi:hypothetical protein
VVTSLSMVWGLNCCDCRNPVLRCYCEHGCSNCGFGGERSCQFCSRTLWSSSRISMMQLHTVLRFRKESPMGYSGDCVEEWIREQWINVVIVILRPSCTLIFRPAWSFHILLLVVSVCLCCRHLQKPAIDLSCVAC